MKNKIYSMILVIALLFSISATASAAGICYDGHSVPNGYEFYRTVRGNTYFEWDMTDNIVSLILPDNSVFETTWCLISSIYGMNPLDELRGYYVTMIYTQPMTNGFWEHTWYYADASCEDDVFLGCKVNQYWVSNR